MLLAALLVLLCEERPAVGGVAIEDVIRVVKMKL